MVFKCAKISKKKFNKTEESFLNACFKKPKIKPLAVLCTHRENEWMRLKLCNNWRGKDLW